MVHESSLTSPPRSTSLIAISLRKFFNFLGWSGVLFILYGVVSAGTGSVWPPIERWVTPASAFLTLTGTLLTAASVYFYLPHPHAPERFSLYVSAPLVVISSFIAMVFLVVYGQLPPVIVNGFALLAISGALFRIQPRPAED